MKKRLLLMSILLLSIGTYAQDLPKDKISKLLKNSITQAKLMGLELQKYPNQLPRTAEKGKLVMSSSDWWCSGFYPGTLWYLYEYSKDPELKSLAEEMCKRIEKEKANTTTHDLGFMMFCSYGNGYRITRTPGYKEVIIQSSNSLCNRFHDKVGLIKSWDGRKQWKYPVIIDNMMNLEMLFWASKATKDPKYRNIATSHADKTLENHFRSDNSCYHVVSYDPATGNVEKKNTCQGYSDESAWARGQSWALYGFTMCYRETKDKRYISQACKIAHYILSHPNLPSDGIPYWDFNAPNIPNEKRDASSAAINASALIELSQYVPKKEGSYFLSKAKQILLTLATPDYLAKTGENSNFILQHSVGSIPHNSEIDVPLTYADYYFVEALIRLDRLSK